MNYPLNFVLFFTQAKEQYLVPTLLKDNFGEISSSDTDGFHAKLLISFVSKELSMKVRCCVLYLLL